MTAGHRMQFSLLQNGNGHIPEFASQKRLNLCSIKPKDCATIKQTKLFREFRTLLSFPNQSYEMQKYRWLSKMKLSNYTFNVDECAASSHSRLQITVIGTARFRHFIITLSASSQIVHFNNKRKVEVLNRHVIL